MSNFMEIVRQDPSGSVRTDMTKLKVAFRNFEKAPNQVVKLYTIIDLRIHPSV
jgi:hypothetical protein